MTKKTVLIIDDDDVLRETLAGGLRDAGFDIVTAHSAENATDILSRISVDAIVLDRMMDGMDGLTFLRQMRARGDMTPTIMLTAMTGAENTIDGLAGGADDYLGKPFQLRELVLRINNITRNALPSDAPMPDGLSVVDGEFFANGVRIALSVAERELLGALTRPVGNIVGATPMVAKRLRNKINGVLSNIDIITVRGMGYKMVVTTPR